MNQHYELLCMGFGEAEYQKIIEDNFMAGYKMVIKPKSEYISHKRKSLTIEEEKKLVDYLMNISYVACSTFMVINNRNENRRGFSFRL